MRIIGGTARGRRLQTPSHNRTGKGGQAIRPTADRAREALFNIIGPEIEAASVLDLYAGTGALGLEALSRSAAQAVFVDISARAIEIISKNIALCGFSDRALVVRRDISKGVDFLAKKLPGTTFSVVFADPPYGRGLAGRLLQELAASALLQPAALVVIEEEAGAELPPKAAPLILVDQRRYGDTGFWLYRRKQPA